MSFGWFTKKKAFWNFTLDTRVMMDVDLPADLFMFLKKGVGTDGSRFNIGNMNAYATMGLQAALGYSREFAKGFRAGFKVRGIAPLAYFGLNMENVSLATSSESWNIETEGYGYTAMQGLKLGMSEGATTPSVEFDLAKMLANRVVAGWGYSLDFGFEYKLDRKSTRLNSSHAT